MEMISDTLKISLVKLAAAQRFYSFASTAFRIQLLLPLRQYFIFEHFEMCLPWACTYLACATWHTGESLVEEN